MRAMLRRSGSVLAALALAVVLLPARAGGLVEGEVIYAVDTFVPGGAVEVRPDGTGLAPAVRGDRTHGGVPRLAVVATAAGLQVTNESGAVIATTDDPVDRRDYAWWSPEDASVLVLEVRAGVSGLYVAHVDWDAGAPVIGPEVLVYETQPGDSFGLAWMADSARVMFSRSVPAPGDQSDLFVLSLATGQVQNVTNTPTASEVTPAASADGRYVAFARSAGRKGRSDLFVRSLLTGVERQVTTKTNAPLLQIAEPAWSPDGKTIAFRASPQSASGFDIYRLAADGSGKARSITSAGSGSYRVPAWRR